MVKKSKRFLLLLLSALLVVMAVSLVACGKKDNGKPGAVKVDTLKYDGYTITWSKPKNADKYKLEITVGNGNPQEKTSYSTTYNYPASTIMGDAETINVSIKALNDEGDESKAVNKTFTKLQTIETSDLVFDAEGMLTWSGVNNAQSYDVNINGTDHNTANPVYTDFIYGQRNIIKVRAKGPDDTFFALWPANPVTKTYLAAPTNVDYDGANITWRGGSTAGAGFGVYINGALYQDNVGNTNMLYDSAKNDFAVQIKALGNGIDTYPSKLSTTQEFIFLGSVENIMINEKGMLVWDPIEKATSYQLHMTDNNNTNTTPIAVKAEYSIPEGLQYSVKIKPATNDTTPNRKYFSVWCDAVNVGLLKAPTLVWNEEYALTDGNPAQALTWNTVNGDVESYNIQIKFKPNDSTVETVSNVSAPAAMPGLTYAYTGVGTYKISVQTLAPLGSDWSNSRYSTELQIIRVPAPSADITNFISSNAKDVTKGFEVRYTNVGFARGYALLSDGGTKTVHSVAQGTYTLKANQIITDTVTEETNLHYKVVATGGIDSSTKTVILGTLIADALAVDIKVLATPTNIQLSGWDVTWDQVSSAPAYGVSADGIYDASTTTWSLKNITTVGNSLLKICAAGNGKEILPSNYSATKNVKKLDAPQNIRIETGEAEGKLLWDEIDGVSSYNVYVNNSNNPIDAGQKDNMNQFIVDSGVLVVVEAVANKWDAANTTYLITSEKSQPKQFTRLATPVIPTPAFKDNSLVWNAPSNVGSSSNLTYVVEYNYLGAGWVKYNGSLDGESMDFSSMNAGDYQLRVKAIGDGKNTINSEYSREASITKLSSPTVTKTETQYSWSRVSGASKYQVWVDGILKDTQDHVGGTETYFYTPDFDLVKTYTVKIIAVGDGGNTTIDSKPTERTQTTKRLTTPEFTFAYSNPDGFKNDATIDVTVSAAVTNAMGYVYTIDGVSTASKETTELTYSYNATQSGEYKIKVRAFGGKFAEDGYYYIDSNEATIQTLKIFSTPSFTATPIGQDGDIKWGAVEGANTYDIIIEYSDSTPKVETNVQGSRYYPTSGTANIISIKVRVHGNGTTTISSAWTTWTKN